ncbi:MAG TPA: hypothetical protein PK358_16000 [Spirochaetota bacterium]|nr:hypothetical protein [Spirochaetota bacterium]HPJ36342.1 hypothetical protein [Spirochaetota bacterium]
MSPEKIEDLLKRRGDEGPSIPFRHPYSVTEAKLYREAMQCPHVGIIEGSEICCLIYDDPGKEGDLLSFFNGTCRNFCCPAWDVLTDREIIFAARLMGDWYYYSLLINDVETLQNLCADYGSPGDVTEEELESLKEELLERFIEEDGK